MTFSRLNAGDTRSLVARIEQEREAAREPHVSTRQFVIALAAILVALVLFGLLLTWL